MKNKTFRRLQEKAFYHRKIIANKVFDDYYCKDVEKVVENIRKYRDIIRKFLEFLVIDYRENSIRFIKVPRKKGKKKYIYRFEFIGPDLRPGTETYGYESLESIQNNLEYISDRFRADFRLQWMLDVPENWDRLKKES